MSRPRCGEEGERGRPAPAPAGHADDQRAEGPAGDLVDRAGEDVDVDRRPSRASCASTGVGRVRAAEGDAQHRPGRRDGLGPQAVGDRWAAARGRSRRRGRSASPRACGRVKTSNTSPCSTMRPPSITATRSAIARTTDISWVISTMVRPSSRLMRREQVEDRAGGLGVERRGRLVGEQHLRASSRARGRCRRAASGRRRARPDSGRACRRGRPDPAARRRGRAIAARSCPRSRAAARRCSTTVRDDSRLKCWKIMPIERRAWRSARFGRPTISAPSTMTRPALGRSSPLTSRISVDLPAPERPMMPRTEPRGTARSMPSSAVTAARRSPPGEHLRHALEAHDRLGGTRRRAAPV